MGETSIKVNGTSLAVTVPDGHIIVHDTAGTSGIAVCPRDGLIEAVADWYTDAPSDVTEELCGVLSELQRRLISRENTDAQEAYLGVEVHVG